MIDLKNKVLLATPKVKDEFFNKSLILIIKEYDNAHMGLILNKPMNETINNFWKTAGYSTEILSKNNIKLGGPLFGSLMLLHKSKKHSDYEIMNNVYLSVNVSSVENALIDSRDKPYEMFVGYSAWIQKQLDYEIQRGSWWVLEPNEYMIFGNDESIWDVYKHKQNMLYLEKLKIENKNWKLN